MTSAATTGGAGSTPEPQPPITGDADASPSANDPFAEYDDFDTEEAENGRIGYSRYGRLSSIALGAVIIIGLLAVGAANWLGDRDDRSDTTPTAAVQASRPAPEFTLALFDGGTFDLAEQRGKVVVVNFWASWCGPCKEEMPALQAQSQAAGNDVVFVGVGARNDQDADARAFAKEYGVTYPVGRDLEGGDDLRGGIEQAYGIPGYPATIVIDPAGNISGIKIGAITTDELDAYIAAARK